MYTLEILFSCSPRCSDMDCCRGAAPQLGKGVATPINVKNRKKRKKKKNGGKSGKNEDKKLNTKITKMTSMQFTNGSKLMSFEEVTPLTVGSPPSFLKSTPSCPPPLENNLAPPLPGPL